MEPVGYKSILERTLVVSWGWKLGLSLDGQRTQDELDAGVRVETVRGWSERVDLVGPGIYKAATLATVSGLPYFVLGLFFLTGHKPAPVSRATIYNNTCCVCGLFAFSCLGTYEFVFTIIESETWEYFL